MSEPFHHAEPAETHAQLAVRYFQEGYNCAQSVFAAFCDVTGLDFQTALRLSSSFGGGMGRLREVCGACSGLFMAAGMLYGYDDPENPSAKASHYLRIQMLASEFRKRHGSLICRELLAEQHPDATPNPTPRTEQFYQERPCARFVEAAAAILDDWLQKEPPLNAANPS